MRRRLHFAFAALAAAAPLVGAVAHGCSTEPDFESVCLWVSDPANCYRKFRIDMEGAGQDCKPLGDPTPVYADPNNPTGVSNGSFLSRDKLDVCYVAGGGQVVFDPPIDLAAYPPSPLSAPITYTMTFKLPDGSTCGNATYTSPHGFSFTIKSPPDAGTGTGGTSPIAADAGDGGPGLPYGSYTQVIPPGGDAFDVTCPSGETHHFNLFEVEGVRATDDGGSQASCPAIEGLVPKASLAIIPGGILSPGAVSFTVYWPPIGQVPNWPDGPDATINPNGPVIAPDVVTYFNCSIAGAPEPCANGIQDGAETDVDCGGGETKPNCPARCGDGQLCVTDCDCLDSMVCGVKAGVRTCTAPEAGPPPARDCSAVILCKDGKKDGSETDVDCGGGDCNRCADGKICLANTDCLNDYCYQGTCQSPSCDDGIQNLGEIGIDCAGPCPTLCGNGSPCTLNEHCQSGNCVNQKCDLPKCNDGVLNGAETDVDCGGTACPQCPNLKKCKINDDCANWACVNGQCLYPSCSDSVWDGLETDKDCGGSCVEANCIGPACPGACADGLHCLVDGDCSSALCGYASATELKCFPASCIDPVTTAVTCGGGNCPLCDDGADCGTNADCRHHACVNGKCTTPSCQDGWKDGNETDVDCGGGDCSPCAPSRSCLVDADCAVTDAGDPGPGTCINKVCQ